MSIIDPTRSDNILAVTPSGPSKQPADFCQKFWSWNLKCKCSQECCPRSQWIVLQWWCTLVAFALPLPIHHQAPGKTGQLLNNVGPTGPELLATWQFEWNFAKSSLLSSIEGHHQIPVVTGKNESDDLFLNQMCVFGRVHLINNFPQLDVCFFPSVSPSPPSIQKHPGKHPAWIPPASKPLAAAVVESCLATAMAWSLSHWRNSTGCKRRGFCFSSVGF